MEPLEVFFVLGCVRQVVPVDPEILKVGKVLQIFKFGHFVHCAIEQGQFRVVLEILNLGDLVLLQVKLL